MWTVKNQNAPTVIDGIIQKIMHIHDYKLLCRKHDESTDINVLLIPCLFLTPQRMIFTSV